MAYETNDYILVVIQLIVSIQDFSFSFFKDFYVILDSYLIFFPFFSPPILSSITLYSLNITGLYYKQKPGTKQPHTSSRPNWAL